MPLRSGVALGALGAVVAAGAVAAPPGVRPHGRRIRSLRPPRRGRRAGAGRRHGQGPQARQPREAHRQVRHHGPRRRHPRPLRADLRRSPRHRRRLRQSTRTPRAPSRASAGTLRQGRHARRRYPEVSPAAERATRLGSRRAKANKETATPASSSSSSRRTGPKLAYEVVTEGIKADQTPTRLHTIVDATTGKTLTSWDDVKQGTGNGIFVGTVTLGTTPAAQQLHDEGPASATTRPTSTRPRPATARRSPTPTTSGATAPHDDRPVGRRRRALRRRQDVRLLQQRARPQRHLEQRHRRPLPRPLRQATTSTPSGTAPR